MNIICNHRGQSGYAARFALHCCVALVLASCAQSPTKTYNKNEINKSILANGLQKPIQINDKTVILDAREPFEFAIAHLPRSVNLQWQDFSDVRGPLPGRLKSDVKESARRLSLLGVSPESQVVVVGNGVAGNGQEGRLAWTLLYLGLENVQTAQIDSLDLSYTNLVEPPRENAKPWEPKVVSSLVASRNEVIKIATAKFDGKSFIIDVRSRAEYFSKNRDLQYEAPDLRALHIEWKEFYNSQGRPNLAIQQQLMAVGVQKDSRIIVISNNGLRSGAVAYALLAQGYQNVSNFAGGYSELLSKK